MAKTMLFLKAPQPSQGKGEELHTVLTLIPLGGTGRLVFPPALATESDLTSKCGEQCEVVMRGPVAGTEDEH